DGTKKMASKKKGAPAAASRARPPTRRPKKAPESRSAGDEVPSESSSSAQAETRPSSEAEPMEPPAEELPEAPSVTEKVALSTSSERGLARRDALQLYMAEVVRHPLLSREEEHELAVRYRETGDLKAAYRLVTSNLRLVVKLAHEYHRNPLSLIDLIQEGNI